MSAPYKILVVDDESDIRDIIVEMLIDEGYSCKSASDGIEASQIISKEDFDLLISDFRMPRMNGAELLSWCRNNKKHFPVIFVTGNPELLPEESFALGDCCALLLQKPITIEELLASIEVSKTRHHAYECHRPIKN